MARHYRFSVEIGTSDGPLRVMRLACGANSTQAFKYSDIVPSGITCKRCLQTWVVRHHLARVLNIAPDSVTMWNVIQRLGAQQEPAATIYETVAHF